VLAEGLPAPISFVQVVQPWPFNPAFLNDQQLDGGAGFMQATGRLKPGVSLAQADAQLHAIAQRYQHAYPGRLDANAENELHTWIDEQAGPVRSTMLMLMVAVGFVLLIACGNVSNLFLGRLSSRQKEVAVRLSLGATRPRLVGRFLLESAIFCVVAGALGVVLALWALRGAERVFVNQLQTPIALTLNLRVLGVALGLSALSSLITGLVPALHGSHVSLSDVLRENARGSVGSGRGTRFRSALIVAEVSLSVVLLVGSALVLAGFVNLQSTRAGFSPDGIASVFVNPGPQRYPTRAERASFYYQVLEKLKSYPQVKAAAVTQGLPLTQNNPRGVYSVFGREIPPVAQRPVAFFTVATEDYFTMLHIPLLRGRLFQPTDIEGSPVVGLLNESFAKRLFPGEDPIGKTLLLGAQGQTKVEIVGVVGDVRTLGLNAPPPETIYNSLRQIGGLVGQSVVASTDGDPALLEPLLRSAVAAVDKSQAVSAFATLNTQLAQSLGIQRVTAWLTGVFATIALLLSTLGLYSVLAYAVAQRTGEIGVRVALGAERTDIVRLVVGQGMRLVVIGLAIGLVVAAATSRLLSSILYGVRPLDPAVFAGVTALFAAVSIVACVVPSLKAARIDALVALRTD
jgi:predicted permease